MHCCRSDRVANEQATKKVRYGPVAVVQLASIEDWYATAADFGYPLFALWFLPRSDQLCKPRSVLFAHLRVTDESVFLLPTYI